MAKRHNALALEFGVWMSDAYAGFGLWPSGAMPNALALVKVFYYFGVWPSGAMRWLWYVAEQRNALALVCGRAT
tara:strand:- start:227 stop:448 length:222 start_codon:yes stop_codon:yes gene_type:complete